MYIYCTYDARIYVNGTRIKVGAQKKNNHCFHLRIPLAVCPVADALQCNMYIYLRYIVVNEY